MQTLHFQSTTENKFVAKYIINRKEKKKKKKNRQMMREKL